MPVMKSVACDWKFAGLIKNHQIGVVTCGNLALLKLAPNQFRGRFRHPARDVRERKAPRESFGIHHWQRNRQTRNATPRSSKDSFGKALRFRGAGRMIGGYQIERSVLQ